MAGMPPSKTWNLVLEPPSSPIERPLGKPLLGLSLPLRLALCAQSAGARAVIVEKGASEIAPLLADRRLTIPVASQDESAAGAGAVANGAVANGAVANRIDPDAMLVRIPAHMVVHRGFFAAAVRTFEERGRTAAAAAGAVSVAPALSRDSELCIGQDPVPFSVPFGFDPITVTDRASARTAERALLRSLRKPQDGWTSTYLNRHISLALTRLLVRTPLRPNQVSVGILAVGLAGAYLASLGDYLHLVAGAVLFQAQSVLDGCDGEMSRLTFRGSRTGEWLDTIGDDLTNYGFFIGAAWGLYRSTGWAGYLVLGLIIVVSGFIGSGLEYRYLVRIGSGDLLKYPIGIGKGAGAQPGSPAPPAATPERPAGSPPDAPSATPARSPIARLLDAISPLFKRDTFVFLTLVGAVLGWLGPFLAVFAAGAVGVLTAVLRAEARMAGTSGQPAAPKP